MKCLYLAKNMTKWPLTKGVHQLQVSPLAEVRLYSGKLPNACDKTNEEILFVLRRPRI